MIIRKANEHDAMGIAHVHVDSWKATYKGNIRVAVSLVANRVITPLFPHPPLKRPGPDM